MAQRFSLPELNLHDPVNLLGFSTAIAATGLITLYGSHKYAELKERKRLGILRKRKQAERIKTLEKLKIEYEFNPKQRSIVDTSFDRLVEQLQSREITAQEVLEAFIAKSVQVTLELNCITEYIPQAMDWAKKLDKMPTVAGPLHGLPFCVKDDHDVKIRMDTTLGYAKYLYDPADESAALVKVLRDLGGVPFCKTNIPQSLFSFGSENSVFGTTLNAWFPERRLGPGGSSSGTGALVGGSGAVFGLGSDTGGSGRIPAHFNGISSLKPTIGRLCKRGVGERFTPGCVGLYGVPSILAPSSKALAFVFQSILEGNLQRKYDTTVVPVPWNVKMYTSRNSLRIGYYTSLPIFPAFEATQKTVLKAKKALEARGHILIPTEIPDNNIFQWAELFRDLSKADYGMYLKGLSYGEEESEAMQHFRWECNYPLWFRSFVSSLLTLIPISHCQALGESLRIGHNASTAAKLWKCMERRDHIVDQLLSSMASLQLDLILCPAFPFPALRAQDIHNPNLFVAITYTCFWNLVDMPAGIVKFGTETGEGLDDYDDGGLPSLKVAKKAMMHSVGAPIGVQVVGKRYEEELILRVLTELEDSSQHS